MPELELVRLTIPRLWDAIEDVDPKFAEEFHALKATAEKEAEKQ